MEVLSRMDWGFGGENECVVVHNVVIAASDMVEIYQRQVLLG